MSSRLKRHHMVLFLYVQVVFYKHTQMPRPLVELGSASVRVHNRGVFLVDTSRRHMPHEGISYPIGASLSFALSCGCPVEALAFSPHRAGIVAVSQIEEGRVGGAVALRRVADGSSVMTLLGHNDHVTAVSFCLNGTLVATRSDDGEVKLWSMPGGELITTLTGGRKSIIVCVALSPDGTSVATGTSDHCVRLWNVSDKECASTTFAGHPGAVGAIAFHPDGSLLAAGSNDVVKLWRVSDGFCERTLAGHRNSVTSVAFSGSGAVLATGSNDCSARLWRVADGVLTATLSREHASSVTSVAFSGNDTIVATGSADKTAKLWRVGDGVCIATIAGHADSVCSVAFSTCGAMLATGSRDHSAKLWHIADGACTVNLIGHTDQVTSVAFSPNGEFVVTGGADNVAKLWHVSDGVCARPLAGHQGAVTSVAFSPCGQFVATSSRDVTAKVWRVCDGVCVTNLAGADRHHSYLSSIAFSPDGVLVMTGSADKTAKMWRVLDGVCVATLANNQQVTSVAFSPDGTLAATGCKQGVVRLWRVDGSSCVATFTHSDTDITAVVFSPDNAAIVTASADKTAKLWRVSDTLCTMTFSGHGAQVSSVAFSPDGTMVATGSSDKTVNVWRAEDGVCVQTFVGHSSYTNAVAFSPDGTMIATGSADKTAKLWRVADGVSTAMFLHHKCQVASAALDLDGKRVAALCVDKSATAWSVADERCLGSGSFLNSLPESITFKDATDEATVLVGHRSDGSHEEITLTLDAPSKVAVVAPSTVSTPTPPLHVSASDYILGDVIGHGSSCVVHDVHSDDKQYTTSTPQVWTSALAVYHSRLEVPCRALHYTDREGVLFSDPVTDASHPCHQFVCEVARPNFGGAQVLRVEMVGHSEPTVAAFWTIHESETKGRALNRALAIANPSDHATKAAIAFLTQSFVPSNDVPLPRARVILAWHATPISCVASVCRDGPRSLRNRDNGYFGAGSYFALEAAYAAQYCTPDEATRECAMILFAVSVSQAHVITIEKDYRSREDATTPHLHGFSNYYVPKGKGKGEPAKALAAGCDAHFIPVKDYGYTHPRIPGETSPVYLGYQAADESSGEATAHELVIASHHRCMPVAVVYLKSNA